MSKQKIFQYKSKIEKKLYKLNFFDPKRLTLPDFLGIGAQKSGTTWLYHNLKQHPDLFLPEQKELHYFDKNYLKSLKSYAGNFKSGAAKIKGEITPAYSILPEHKIHFINKIKPDLKAILLLRRPVERAWSQALMNLVKLPENDFKDVPEQTFIEHFKAERSILRGDYKAIIQRWNNHFEKRKLFIGFFKEIKDNPKALMRKIFSHLNVAEDVDWEQFPLRSKSNKGVEIKMPSFFRKKLENLYEDDIRYYKEEFGENVLHW